MLEMLKARKEALQERGVKGFTLMEMLIVIAIIAVLIAIAIPVLSGQLENAREATDAANLRSAYATASVVALENNQNTSAGPVKMEQTTADWESSVKTENIGGIVLGTDTVTKTAVKDVTFYVNVSAKGDVSITTAVPTGYTQVSPINGQAVTS